MGSESHRLPGVLAEIADLVGVEAALAVSEAVGGVRAYIPRQPGDGHWLTAAVGAERAAVIAEHFTTGRTGVELNFPVGPGGSYNRERRQRARRIAEMVEQGLQPTEIARQAGITRRGAQMAKARIVASGDPRQGKLDL